MKWGSISRNYQTFFIIVLLFLSVVLTYYFHFILKTGIIFTHFFYILIVLASIWWKRKGLVVPVFLAFILFFSDFFFPLKADALLKDLFRMIIFISVGIIVVILSERIEKNQAQLSLVTNNMVDVICQVDNRGIYRYVSPSIKLVLGYEPQNMIGKSMFDFIHPDDLDKVTSCMNNAMEGSLAQTAQYRYYNVDGEYIWVETRGNPLIYHDSEINGFVCNTRDITVQKEAEDALQESEEKYRFLIESARDPISVVDQDGVFLMANTAGAKLMNLDVTELLGKTMWDYFSDSADLQMGIIREVIQNKKGVDVELPIKYGEKEMWFSTSIEPIILKDGSVDSVQIIARDINELKKVQKQLEKTLEDKDMLMKEIYHRVKNNLMVISSLLNLQSRYIKDKEAKGMFKESQSRPVPWHLSTSVYTVPQILNVSTSVITFLT